MGNSLKEKYLLVSEKSWHDDLFHQLKNQPDVDWYRINNKNDFTFEKITSINPDKVFIPHWSYIIPKSIYETFECIVFHMTDLPYGRGGSPLQNLIVKGKTETVISAIKVDKGIDTGDVYLKRPLNLQGAASDIFIRAASVIGDMISEIINNHLVPIPQTGEVVNFKRRTPEQGNISNLTELNQVFDYIRMLDCEGYPNAFIETSDFKFEFTNAILTEDKFVSANVRITKK